MKATNNMQESTMWFKAGDVKISSGKLLITDPMYLPRILENLVTEVDHIPPGSYPVELLEENLEDWGKRITQARIKFLPIAPNERKMIGSAGVDSGSLMVIDPTNIGTLTNSGDPYDQVAKLITGVTGYGTLSFPDNTSGLTVVFTTGVGDGEYPVFALYNDDKLVGIELEF